MKEYRERYEKIISLNLEWKDEYKELKTLRIEVEKRLKTELKKAKENYDKEKAKINTEFEVLNVIKTLELTHKVKYDIEKEKLKKEAMKLLLPERKKELKELGIILTDNVILSYNEKQWINFIEDNKKINETLSKAFATENKENKDKICIKLDKIEEILKKEITDEKIIKNILTKIKNEKT